MGAHEYPRRHAGRRQFQALAPGRIGDQYVAVRQALGGAHHTGKELASVRWAEFVDDSLIDRVEFDHSGPTLLEAVVEDQQIAVVEHCCSVGAG